MPQNNSDSPVSTGANGAAGNTDPRARAPESVQPGVPRKQEADPAEKPRALWEFAPEPSKPVENSIKPFTARIKTRLAAPAEEATPPQEKSTTKLAAERKDASDLDIASVPEDIRERFVRRGRKYHLPDGTHVFTDRGKRLTTPSENTEIIASLIQIAQSRGWTHIAVSGTERFRREAWGAAQLAGLEVRGYQPTEQEQGLVVRRIARQRTGEVQGQAQAPSLAAKTRTDLWVGKLIDHGPAPYKGDPKQAMSYFVRIETSAGESTLWGVDFERALKQSASRPQMGDDITLRSLGQKAVTISVPSHDADGRVIGERKVKAHRNRWLIERTDFLRDRAAVANVIRDAEVAPARAVQTHPSLAGTYLAIHAAELASKQFRDPKDQARFVEIVRNGLADSIERGEPLQAVRLRERAVEHAQVSPSPVRDLTQARNL